MTPNGISITFTPEEVRAIQEGGDEAGVQELLMSIRKKLSEVITNNEKSKSAEDLIGLSPEEIFNLLGGTQEDDFTKTIRPVLEMEAGDIEEQKGYFEGVTNLCQEVPDLDSANLPPQEVESKLTEVDNFIQIAKPYLWLLQSTIGSVSYISGCLEHKGVKANIDILHEKVGKLGWLISPAAPWEFYDAKKETLVEAGYQLNSGNRRMNEAFFVQIIRAPQRIKDLFLAVEGIVPVIDFHQQGMRSVSSESGAKHIRTMGIDEIDIPALLTAIGRLIEYIGEYQEEMRQQIREGKSSLLNFTDHAQVSSSRS